MLARRHLVLVIAVLPLISCAAAPGHVEAVDATVNRTMGHMWARVPVTRTLSARAAAMLIVPAKAEPVPVAALVHNTEEEGYEAPAAGYYDVSMQPAPRPGAMHAVFFMSQAALEAFESTPTGTVGPAGITPVRSGAAEASTFDGADLIIASFGRNGLRSDAAVEHVTFRRIAKW